VLRFRTTLTVAVSAVRKVFYLFTIITATVGIGYYAAVQGVSGRRMNKCFAFQHQKESRRVGSGIPNHHRQNGPL
jgi:hypothetical protein